MFLSSSQGLLVYPFCLFQPKQCLSTNFYSSPPELSRHAPSYLEDGGVSDQPESDQHLIFPKNSQHGHGLFINTIGSVDLLEDVESSLSCDSLGSENFYSDLVFSETPSPVGFQYSDHPSSLVVEDWRSCPELDKERIDSFSRDCLDLSKLTTNMEKNVSKSAHALKVGLEY